MMLRWLWCLLVRHRRPQFADPVEGGYFVCDRCRQVVGDGHVQRW
jgi:hypothetical protein